MVNFRELKSLKHIHNLPTRRHKLKQSKTKALTIFPVVLFTTNPTM